MENVYGEHHMSSEAELMVWVRNMRMWQKKFFQLRTQNALNTAQQYEILVDKYLQGVVIHVKRDLTPWQEFLVNLRQMRGAQIIYFTTKAKMALVSAKVYEKKVDKYVDNYYSPLIQF